MLIGTVREFRQGVESQMQPVRIVLEFAPIGRRHLVEGKFRLIMIVPEKAFQDKFTAVFFMQGFQSFEVKMVKQPGRFLPREIRHEETVVVDPHGVAFEGGFVPNQHNALGPFSEFIFSGRSDRIDFRLQRHFGAEFAVAADRGNAVDRNAALRIGNAADFDQ